MAVECEKQLANYIKATVVTLCNKLLVNYFSTSTASLEFDYAVYNIV